MAASESGLYVTSAVPPARWRIVAALALLVALALLALTLAHWGWTWFGPQPAVIALAAPETDLARRSAEARLFGASIGGPGVTAAAGTDLGELRLLGLFAERDGKGYALFRAGARGPLLVSAGQEIAPGVRVEAVRADGVSLTDHGTRRELSLRARIAGDKPRLAAAAPAAPAAVCTGPPGFKGPVVRLNAELLGGMIDSPQAWKALVAPASGALVVRDQSGFAGMLGLRNGDRVERANGIALAIPDDIPATILQPLTRSQPVWLAGKRDGKPQQWLYLNAGACPA